MSKRHHLDALADVIKEAEDIAHKQGRVVPAYADAKAAIDGVLVPAALDKQAIFSEEKQQPRRPAGSSASLTAAPVRPMTGRVAEKIAEGEEEPATNRLNGSRLAEFSEV